MFDIRGDDIEFDGILVARLVPTKMHTLQDRAREALYAGLDEQQKEDVRDEAHREGHTEGHKEGTQQAIEIANLMRGALERIADSKSNIKLCAEQRKAINNVLKRWDLFCEAHQ